MSDNDLSNSSRISYSVKEILQSIQNTVAGIDAKLDSKADKAEVAVLAQRVEVHEKRIDGHDYHIAASEKAQQQQTEGHRFRVPLIVGIITWIGSPFIWYGVSHLIK